MLGFMQRVMWGVLVLAAAVAPGPAMAQGVHTITGVDLLVEEGTLWTGRTAMVPFRLAEPAVEDIQVQSWVLGEGAWVTRPGEVLEGQQVGHVRVWAQPGAEQTTVLLRVGDAQQDLRLAASPAEALTAEGPRVISPINDAVVWGRLGVGVELPPRATDDGWAADGREVRLRLPDGTLLEADEATQPAENPLRRFAFTVDADALAQGLQTLVPVVVGDDGQPVPDAGVDPAGAVRVRVMRPGVGQLRVEEAEARRHPRRPDRYRDQPLRVGQDPDASGGVYVNNAGDQPTVALPIKPDRGGWYQLIVRASGDPAAGVMPHVGAYFDNSNDPRTGAAVTHTDGWARIAVGRPFHLSDEKHIVLPRFANDFNAGRGVDRNLRLDTVELLRLPGSPASWPGDTADQDDALAAPADDTLWVAIDPSLHRATAAGDLPVQVRTRVTHRGGQQPRITLHINGQPALTGGGDHIRFDVSRGHLQPGENTLVAHAQLADGRTARSQPITLRLADHPARPEPVTIRRFNATDPRVTGVPRRNDRPNGNRPTLAFSANGSADMPLPDDATGPHRLLISARGDAHEGWPIARLVLHHDGQEQPLGEIEVNSGGYRNFYLDGRVDLPAGPKRLSVRFINDLYDGNDRDRNLYVRTIRLDPVRSGEDQEPVARILYPSPRQSVFGADAVVFEVADDRQVRAAELVIDGEPTGQIVEIDNGMARHVLPLPLRVLDAGRHRLAVRVVDSAQQTATSDRVEVRISHEPPPQPGPYARALRVLDRFGWGPEPRALADILVEGPGDYLRDRLLAPPDEPGSVNAMTWARIRYPADNNQGHVVRRALTYQLTEPNPLRARFVLFADNHFNTWMRKVRPENKAPEHSRFTALGIAPMEDLLWASATSPAMLVYLDQQRSFGNRINENYAREIMELHSLGVHGGYTQDDVTQLAHLLTGWTTAQTAPPSSGNGFRPHRFAYEPVVAEPDAQRVYTLALPAATDPADRFDRVRLVVETLARHPATARFMATKLAEHYVAHPADEELVDDIAQVLLASGGDFRQALLALADHPTVADPRLEERLAHPMQFGLRLSRTLGVDNPGYVADYLGAAGFGLFDRDTPDGYPEEDHAYADSNAMLQRWRLAGRMQGPMVQAFPGLPELPEDTPAPVVRRYYQQMVDLMAVRLTGRLLSGRSNEAALQVMLTSNADREARLVLLGSLITQLPEASLR